MFPMERDEDIYIVGAGRFGIEEDRGCPADSVVRHHAIIAHPVQDLKDVGE